MCLWVLLGFRRFVFPFTTTARPDPASRCLFFLIKGIITPPPPPRFLKTPVVWLTASARPDPASRCLLIYIRVIKNQAVSRTSVDLARRRIIKTQTKALPEKGTNLVVARITRIERWAHTGLSAWFSIELHYHTARINILDLCIILHIIPHRM